MIKHHVFVRELLYFKIIFISDNFFITFLEIILVEACLVWISFGSPVKLHLLNIQRERRAIKG